MNSRWNILWNVAGVLVIVSLLGSVTARAEEISETLTRLNRQAAELYAAGKYEQAIPFEENALEMTERSQGPYHPDTATSLNNLAELYRMMGAYSKAEPLHQRALTIREKALGPDHPDTAQSLNNLAALYLAMGVYAKAEPLLQRAFTINEKALGPDHPDTASSLNNLALLYKVMGSYSKAEPLYQRALAIREKALGPDHPDTAQGLNNLAALYQAMGAYSKAELLSQRALTITEKALGPDHPQTAGSLSNLAALYQAMGAYSKAELLSQRALAITEKALGPDHPQTAGSLNNLAELYRVMGVYSKAEPLYHRALAIRENVLGPDHPDTAQTLNNLAGLYWVMGAYSKAEPLLQRALEIHEKALGPDHPDTATSLDNLAEIYRVMGAYSKAEPLLQRALAIREKALGPDHPDTVTSLNILALLYQALGAYGKAEPLLQRAVTISEKTLGPDHPNTGYSLNNLAGLYWVMGAYSKAEPLLQRALAISEKALGPDHPGTASSLNSLALLYEAMEPHAKAEPLHQRALAILEKTLGPVHPETAKSLNNLALLFWTEDRWSEAREGFRRVARIQESNAQSILALGDESRKRAYLETLTPTTYATVTFSLTDPGNIEHFNTLGLELVLQRKGRVLEVLADTFGETRRSLAAQDRQLFDRWREANAQYATVFFRGPQAMPAANYRTLIDGLKGDAEILEGQLSQRSAEFRSQTETVTLERVQRAIPVGSALIEWFRYSPLNPMAKGQEQQWGAPRYVAYVLKQVGKPVAVDLGEAAAIERTLSDLLVALHDPASTLTNELGRELDIKLLQPLRPHLGDVSQLFLSPDGQLNLLPFGALVDEQQRYLAERWQITYLTSGRDLLRFAQAPSKGKQSIVIANPDFGRIGKTTLASAAESRCGAMQFNPLPGTAAEAKALKGILKLKGDQVLTGTAATKTALKQAQGPHILHISTHGFFCPDQPRNLESPTGRQLGQEIVAPPEGENPLLRSGLALAGANAPPHSGQSDGLLTALEVAGLDLTGTQLAVLSACETGVGDVQNGEGVYSLRRALVLAGVRTQVTSLWKVDDTATKDLMVDYYRRLQAGAGKSQALREAQLAMRKNPARAHPYYWASFIAIGEDKPINQ